MNMLSSFGLYISRLLPSTVIDLIAEKILVPYFASHFGPMTIRPNTSDLAVFKQVFLARDYELPSCINCVNPLLIIDAGANIGLASIWFARKYPSAEIVAIEPDESNFRMLELNTRKLKCITRIRRALWPKRAFLRTVDHGRGAWGIVTEVAARASSNVSTITINEVLHALHRRRVDILKLDIEGAEKELFSENYGIWLNKVDVIVIELHDRLKLGCTEAFLTAIRESNFTCSRNGEKIIAVRSRLHTLRKVVSR